MKNSYAMKFNGFNTSSLQFAVPVYQRLHESAKDKPTCVLLQIIKFTTDYESDYQSSFDLKQKVKQKSKKN